jgi:hypothetical protein
MGTPESNPPPKPLGVGSNRRGFERFALDRPGRITELDQFGNPGHTWDVRVVDLSRGGVGIRSRRMVHMGRLVVVEMDTAEPGRCKVLFGAVKQSRYAEGEGYAIGVQFRAFQQTATLRAWLAGRGLAA